MRSILLAALSAALFLAPVWGQAQTSGEDANIEALLSMKSITWSHASWLVGRASGAFDESVTTDQAAQKASAAGWGPSDLAPWAPVNLAAYSQLLVKAFSIPTGVVYSVFPGPRYALRELIFRKIVPATLAPDDAVSGEEAMRYLQATQDWKEAKQ